MSRKSAPRGRPTEGNGNKRARSRKDERAGTQTLSLHRRKTPHPQASGKKASTFKNGAARRNNPCAPRQLRCDLRHLFVVNSESHHTRRHSSEVTPLPTASKSDRAPRGFTLPKYSIAHHGGPVTRHAQLERTPDPGLAPKKNASSKRRSKEHLKRTCRGKNPSPCEQTTDRQAEQLC